MTNLAIKPCWILCNPRSGSSILCDLLNFTDKFPAFDHPGTSLRRGPLEKGLAFNEWFRLYNTPADFEKQPPPFVKSLFHQYDDLLGQRGPGNIRMFLPEVRFILLKRKNLAEHILSQYFAETTQTYHIYNQSQLQEYLSQQIHFVLSELKKVQEKVSEYKSNWNWFLDGEQYLTIYYEDVIRTPGKTIREILSFCEIPYQQSDIERSLKMALVERPRILKMTRPELNQGKELLQEIEKKESLRNTKFNTQPVLFHAPGKMSKNPAWKQVSNVYYSPKKDCERLEIITWNNRVPSLFLKQNEKSLGIFEDSLGILRHTILGKNIPRWHNRIKLMVTSDHLATSSYEFTLGADSSDVTIKGEPEEILRRFLAMDCDILFNAELFFWPDNLNAEIKHFEEKVSGISEFKYLNGGLWIGRTSFCQRVFDKARRYLDTESGSEQAILKQVYKEFYPRIRLDHECKIFQVLNSIPDILKPKQKPAGRLML